jgi:hypothetical protein
VKCVIAQLLFSQTLFSPLFISVGSCIIYKSYRHIRVNPFIPPDFSRRMTTHKVNKRPRDEDSDHGESDSSDADPFLELSPDDTTPTKGKKRSRLETSNVDIVKSTAFKKLRTASRGSIGIPAVRALLAKSGSKFAAASRETNSGLRKAVTASGARKISNVKGKEKAAR